MTDELLDSLSRDLRPARKGLVAQRLAIGLLAGGFVAFVGVSVLLGLRSDMPQAVFTAMFWIKLGYTGALAAVGLWCVERLSRPAGDAAGRMPWLLAPLTVIGVLAAIRLWYAPPAMRHSLMMGASASVCPWYILLTAVPLFAALVWALRGLAPTRLRAAGAIAGLTAGGVGASVYALHCPENTAPFVAIWYTAGMLGAGVMGALVGPRVLRW